MTKIFAKIVESREMTLKLGKIKHEPRNNNWVKNFLVAYFFSSYREDFTIVSFICISSDECLPKSKYLNKYEIRVIKLKYINIQCNVKKNLSIV